MTIKNMTREDFMELFDFREGSDEIDYYDSMHEDGTSWFNIARYIIDQMDFMIREM